MPHVIIGDHRHRATRTYPNFGYPAVSGPQVHPSLFGNIENTADQVANQVAVTDENLVFVFSASGSEVRLECGICLLSGLLEDISRKVGERGLVIYAGGRIKGIHSRNTRFRLKGMPSSSRQMISAV